MKPKKKVKYVDNQKFYEEIVKYRKQIKENRENGIEDPPMPNYIGECIYKIADRLSMKPCFANYSFRDEMVSDGIENCILYFKDYDPDYSNNGAAATPNPFAYFTQIIYYAFLRRISKEEKHRYIMYKNFQETMTQIHEINNTDDGLLIPTSMYDNINVFMKKFEKKEEEKRVKRKEVKVGLQKFYEEDNGKAN